MNAETEVRSRITKAEAWRPALIAFYEHDEMRQKAANLKRGAPLDYLDLRTIAALEAAFINAAVTA
jgi:hypothetical protein